MSDPSASPRVLLETTDLFFRAKLDGLIRSCGCQPTRVPPADVAVIELGKPDALQRIGVLADAGIPVLAFGSHVAADALRAAREAGAVAVPNSQVESRLRGLLGDLASG